MIDATTSQHWWGGMVWLSLLEFFFFSPLSEYKHPKGFLWEKYLEETGTQAAPARAFKPVWVSHSQRLITGSSVIEIKS